jgi:hypothetical protein
VRDLAFYVEGVAEGRRGVLVQRQKDRSVWRVEEGGVVWFAKRGLTPKRRREIRREASSAAAVHAAGFGPRVLASGEHAHAMWIVTERAGGLPTRMPGMLGRSVAPRHFQALVRGIRRFHDAGFGDADLVVSHVTVIEPDGIEVIDCARVERFQGAAPMTIRARDLAAFVFTAPDAFPSRVWRLRLLREATGAPDAVRRSLFALVDRRLRSLAVRTRWRHRYERMDGAFYGAFGATFDADAWGHRFEELFEPEHFTIVRTLPDRENRTLGRDASGRPLFFVKVFPATKTGWSPAMREVAAIDLFQRAGIVVNRLAAYAEDVDKGSMVGVKAARGEPLDDLLRRGVSVAERRALAVQTARIWRRMRECGLRHRDAYPCHLFAAPWGREPLRFELRLIDLTRAGRAPFPKERWFVKDAAALWHGLPKPPVTRTDAVRWLREYFRIDRLDARAKRFARRVAAKEARIAARQARKSKR